MKNVEKNKDLDKNWQKNGKPDRKVEKFDK